MQETNEDIIKWHKNKRRKHKIKLAIKGSIAIIAGIITIGTYMILSKDRYINYTEKTDVDYKVYLKENDFYKTKYVEKGTNAIASLVTNIESEFTYELGIEEEQEYTYDYKIMSQINVTEGTRGNTIYSMEEQIMKKEKQTSKEKNLKIKEKIDIDYNEYNEKMNKFKELYKLNNTTSTLSIKMYVNVVNKYDGSKINKENNVITLDIPLTTQTVDINLASDIIQDEGKVLVEKSQYENIKYVFVIGIILFIIGIVELINLINYILETRSAEAMYEQSLRNILFNYKSYIQKINNEVELKKYKVLEINEFKEILEMRETLQSPILMYTDEKEERTKFMIIKDEVLFVYVLGVKEIRNKLIEESKKKQEKQENKQDKKE